MEHSKILDEVKASLSRFCKFPRLIGYQKEFSYVKSLVLRTIQHGESNSALIVGPRGSGKTLLINSVLQDLTQSEREGVIIIQLNGLIHTDDRQALREITRQLKYECTETEDVNISFAESLQLVLQTFRSGDEKNKALLLVLEESDLLAAHRNQSLLYNLLDSCQSRHTPLCVLALSSRLDVLDVLEKRVRSRFSGRMVHLLPARLFSDYCEMAQSLLMLDQPAANKIAQRQWNGHIKRIFLNNDVLDTLRRRHQLDTSIAALKHFLYLTLCQVQEEPSLEKQHFVSAQKQLTSDSVTQQLLGLSVLELSLACAAQNLCIIYDNEPFNFEMLYREYRKASLKKSAVQQYDKAIVMKALEQLLALELLCFSDTAATSRVSLAHRPLQLCVLQEQLRDALRMRRDCPVELSQWAQGNLILG